VLSRKELSDMARDISDSSYSRRQFLKAAGLLLGAAASVPLLDACATSAPPPPAAATQAPAAAAPTQAPAAAAPTQAPAAAAGATPAAGGAAAGGLKRFEGVTINSGFTSGEHDETLLREWIPKVKQDLGITLTVNDLGPDALHDKISQGVRAGQPPYEVSAIVGFWLADMIGGGFFEPLDKYLDDPTLTPPDFDRADLVEKHLDYISYWNLDEKRNGRPGQFFLMPGPHSDAHMITYRKDLFEKYGVAGPPKTWDEFVD